MDDAQLIDNVAQALLARRGITWVPDAVFSAHMTQAAGAAIGLLRSHAGNPSLSFEEGEDFDLAVTCAWYLAENRRAEFLREYGQDLIWLRAREAIKDGNDQDSDVS